jgi:hypothetical protein
LFDSFGLSGQWPLSAPLRLAEPRDVEPHDVE